MTLFSDKYVPQVDQDQVITKRMLSPIINDLRNMSAQLSSVIQQGSIPATVTTITMEAGEDIYEGVGVVTGLDGAAYTMDIYDVTTYGRYVGVSTQFAATGEQIKIATSGLYSSVSFLLEPECIYYVGDEGKPTLEPSEDASVLQYMGIANTLSTLILNNLIPSIELKEE